MADNELSDVTSLTVELLSVYLANNTIHPNELAELIRSTRTALAQSAVTEVKEIESETYTRAVSIRKSLANPEYLLSLVDGKPYKTLKRHLAAHGLTPQTYRERYDLPASYPMVAPAFAQKRRAIAEAIGLGRSRKAAADKASAPPKQAEKSGKRPARSDKATFQSKNADSLAASVSPARIGPSEALVTPAVSPVVPSTSGKLLAKKAERKTAAAKMDRTVASAAPAVKVPRTAGDAATTGTKRKVKFEASAQPDAAHPTRKTSPAKGANVISGQSEVPVGANSAAPATQTAPRKLPRVAAPDWG